MPIIVPSHELQPGMRLAEAFIHKGQIMLPGGRELTVQLISLIRDKYPTTTLRIGDPVIDSFTEFDDDAPQREVARKATQRIAQCMAGMQQRLDGHSSLGGVDFEGIKNAVQDVIEYLRDNPVSTAMLTNGMDQSSYMADHAGNVFYLSMVLGAAVRDYVYRERVRQTSSSSLSPSLAMNLLPLGLGAMFIDLGMIPLAGLLDKAGPLTDDERKLVENHPIAGADLLPESLPPQVRMIVRTHHENFDGSGYPYKMKGAALHIFTRIIRIADAFDAATAKQVYRDAKTPARTLWEMSVGPYRHMYDPVLMKVLTSIIQPFPIGAKLKLSSGEYGVVCKHARRDPFHPSVIVAFDADGQQLPQALMRGPLQVGADSSVKVAAFAGEDLSYLHSTDAVPLMSREQTVDSVFAASYP